MPPPTSVPQSVLGSAHCSQASISHRALAQSLRLAQVLPVAQRGHVPPPQSTSVSAPFVMPSLQVGPDGWFVVGQRPWVSPCCLWPFTADFETVIVFPWWQSVTLPFFPFLFLVLLLPFPFPPFLARVSPAWRVSSPPRPAPASPRSTSRREGRRLKVWVMTSNLGWFIVFSSLLARVVSGGATCSADTSDIVPA